MAIAECRCLTVGPERSEERFIGVDKTAGRFANVTLRRCRECGRLWLRYFVEYEAFTASGRWAEGLIGEKEAERVVPEQAAGFLDGLDWYIFGGSFFGDRRKRGSGHITWWDHFGEG